MRGDFGPQLEHFARQRSGGTGFAGAGVELKVTRAGAVMMA